MAKQALQHGQTYEFGEQQGGHHARVRPCFWSHLSLLSVLSVGLVWPSPFVVLSSVRRSCFPLVASLRATSE